MFKFADVSMHGRTAWIQFSSGCLILEGTQR